MTHTQGMSNEERKVNLDRLNIVMIKCYWVKMHLFLKRAGAETTGFSLIIRGHSVH